MASRITTEDLIKKCMVFLTSDLQDRSLESLVKEAILKADRELRRCDSFYPLAWDIVPFDGIRTTRYAEITALTAADPGVITAESSDSSITGHGFRNNASDHQDIVIIDSLDEPEELNRRAYLLDYVSSTTFSLKNFDGTDAIDTSGLTAYSSGGVVYHAGLVLKTTVLLANISAAWTMKDIVDVTFDGYPTNPLSDKAARADHRWMSCSHARRPSRFRYWQHHKTAAASPTVAHYLMWYPPANSEYNLFFNYQKEIAEFSAWSSTEYPFHPAEVHDAIWHGALANLVGDAKRMERQSADRGHVTKVEILFAQKWLEEWEADKRRVREYSRRMLGDRATLSGMTA